MEEELFSVDECVESLNTFVKTILKKEDISFKELIDMLKEKREGEVILKVPSSIFKERSLGILEALTKYLKEELGLSYHQIATLLNRDDRVIWRTYNNTRKKFKLRFKIDNKAIPIPVSIFTDRKLGVLEAAIKYLREDLKLSYREIGGILNRDNRTIWSSYNRAKNRNGENKLIKQIDESK